MLKLDRYTKLGIFALLSGHLLAAYFSFGYHHPDEHFQILEWAHYFIGLAPDASHLPWEFASQIRPWFQPLCHAFFMKAALILGIYNPFELAFFFRLIYAALNIWSVMALWNYFQEKYELSSKWFLLTSLIWFFPYIHVRTSSENLAGIFLSFALLTLVKNQNSLKSFFQAGVLFGFAFLARYQIALGLLGLGTVLLISDRGLKKTHTLLIAGFVLPIGLGVLLDRWGYGNWVFTPYQYFKVNLVDHVADRFNPYPWYQYFIWVAQLNPFISLPLFYGVIRFSLKNKTNVFTGFIFSFFILHCFITNKEYRFLLPVMNIAPFMAAAYFETVVWTPLFLAYYTLTNLLAFGISSFHGASTQTFWPAHVVNQHFRSYPHSTWFSNRNYLYEKHEGYYDLKAVPGFEPHDMRIYHSDSELKSFLTLNPDSNVLIDGNLKDPLTQSFIQVIETLHCSLISSAFPKILSEKTKVTYQALYHCTISDSHHE